MATLLARSEQCADTLSRAIAGEMGGAGAAQAAEQLRAAVAAGACSSSAATAAATTSTEFRAAHVAEATEVFAADVDAVRREEGFGSARDVACLVDVLALGARRADGQGGSSSSLERQIALELMAS